MPSTIRATTGTARRGEPLKRKSAQHHEMSRSATSRLLAQLIPRPLGFASIHSPTDLTNASE